MEENPNFKIKGSSGLEITPSKFFHIPAIPVKCQKEEVIICGKIEVGGIVVGNKIELIFPEETVTCSICGIKNIKNVYVQYANANESVQISVQGISIKKLKEMNQKDITEPFIHVTKTENTTMVVVGHPKEFNFNFLGW